MTAGPLTCPSCGLAHPSDERFCRDCSMPLVLGDGHGGEEPVTPFSERVRKIKPQYAEGALVRVIGAMNQTEAEFIQGMLLEEGVPSTLRRTMGFDVPDMLAAGPRDVMVPLSGHAAARDVLLQAELVEEQIPPGTSPAQVALFLLIALVVVAVIALLIGGLGG